MLNGEDLYRGEGLKRQFQCPEVPEIPFEDPFVECFFVEVVCLTLRGLHAMMGDWPSIASDHSSVDTSLPMFHLMLTYFCIYFS